MTRTSIRTLFVIPCIAGLVLTGSCEPAPEVVDASTLQTMRAEAESKTLVCPAPRCE